MSIKETGCADVSWIHLVHGTDQLGTLVNMVMNLRVP